MSAGAVARRDAQPPAANANERASKATPAIRSVAPGRRRRNSKGPLIAFALIVGLPTLIAALYYGLIASPIFVSEAGVTIRSSRQQGSSLLENLVTPQDGIVGQSETQLVADYLRSRDILERVENDVGFRSRYATFNADFLTRLEPNSSQEAAHSYFKRVVRVSDDGAGLLTLTVRAFTPEDALAVANSAIEAAEAMVNRLSETAQEDAMKAARAEVAAAEARLADMTDALMALQKSSGDFDPRRSAESVLGVISSLEGELAATRIRRAEIGSYLKPGSPAISAIDSKIAALRRQIAEERRRLAASNSGTLADDLRVFETQRLQRDLAETAYKSALASLEAARLAAQNDRSYLVAYAPPSRPDVAIEPDRPYKIATVFVVSLLAFGVGALILGAIREHARA